MLRIRGSGCWPPMKMAKGGFGDPPSTVFAQFSFELLLLRLLPLGCQVAAGGRECFLRAQQTMLEAWRGDWSHHPKSRGGSDRKRADEQLAAIVRGSCGCWGLWGTRVLPLKVRVRHRVGGPDVAWSAGARGGHMSRHRDVLLRGKPTAHWGARAQARGPGGPAALTSAEGTVRGCPRQEEQPTWRTRPHTGPGWGALGGLGHVALLTVCV